MSTLHIILISIPDCRRVDDKEYSERVSALIDGEVSKIMNESFVRAKDLLNENRNILDAIANKLVEVENLEQEEYEKIIVEFGVKLKKKSI
jgi:cell division protease FtsH